MGGIEFDNYFFFFNAFCTRTHSLKENYVTGAFLLSLSSQRLFPSIQEIVVHYSRDAVIPPLLLFSLSL